MANLDTRSKRASSVGIALPFILAPVLPDGTIAQGDRQHTAWSYSGILATAAVSVFTHYVAILRVVDLPHLLEVADVKAVLKATDTTETVELRNRG